MRPTILLIHPTIRPVGVDILKAHAEITLAPDGEEDTLVGQLKASDADAIIVRVEPATRRMFAEAPGLKVVGMHGVGTDAIDLDAATEHGVVVLNTPFVNFKSTSEHALALLMAVAKNIMPGDRAVREGRFTEFRNSHLPMELEGRSLFVIGLGRIGSEMARKCLAAFGMRVMSYDPAYDADAMAAQGVERVSFEQGLAEADFVTVHVPLKADTRGMMNAAAFARMKRGSIFINASRGPVVVQAALIEALRSGHLLGAGLDVLDPEPVPADDPINTTPNLVLSPHYAGDTVAARSRCSETIAGSVLGALAGRELAGIVNPDVLSRPNFRLGKTLADAGWRPSADGTA